MQLVLNHGLDVAKVVDLQVLLGCTFGEDTPRLMQIVSNAAIKSPITDSPVKSALQAALDSDNRQVTDDLRNKVMDNPVTALWCIDALYDVLLGERNDVSQVLLRKGASLFVGTLGDPLSPIDTAALNGHAGILNKKK
jgi:hypothetical protein